MFVPLTRLRCSKSDPQRGNGNAEFKMRDGRGFMSPRLQSRIPSGEAQQMRGVDPKHCARSRGRPPLRSSPPLLHSLLVHVEVKEKVLIICASRARGRRARADAPVLRQSVRPSVPLPSSFFFSPIISFLTLCAKKGCARFCSKVDSSNWRSLRPDLSGCKRVLVI